MKPINGSLPQSLRDSPLEEGASKKPSSPRKVAAKLTEGVLRRLTNEKSDEV